MTVSCSAVDPSRSLWTVDSFAVVIASLYGSWVSFDIVVGRGRKQVGFVCYGATFCYNFATIITGLKKERQMNRRVPKYVLGNVNAESMNGLRGIW
jgi:hypothetical protein